MEQKKYHSIIRYGHKTTQDSLNLGEVEVIIVTDSEDNVIAVVDSKRIIEHEGYKVIIDKK